MAPGEEEGSRLSSTVALEESEAPKTSAELFDSWRSCTHGGIAEQMEANELAESGLKEEKQKFLIVSCLVGHAVVSGKCAPVHLSNGCQAPAIPDHAMAADA